MPKKDGGTAFPMQDGSAIHAYASAAIQDIKDPEERDTAYLKARSEAVTGMSLRDYFAAGFASAQATTTSADTNFIKPDYVDPRDDRSVAQKIAESSYALADAMLAARNQKQDPTP